MCLQSVFGGKNKITDAIKKIEAEIQGMGKDFQQMKKEVMEVKGMVKKKQEAVTAPDKVLLY